MRIIDEHRHIGLSGSRGNPSINDIIFQLDTFDIDHAILAPGDRPRQNAPTPKTELAETTNIYETVRDYLTTGRLTPNIITLQRGEPYHNEVLNAARATDGRLLGCWLLNPHLGEIEFNKVRSAVLDEGFRYIKLHPPHHAFAADNLQLLDPVMTLARQLDVPVWIHSSSGPGTEVTQLARLAAGFPDVNIFIEPLNRYETNLVNTIEQAINLIKETASDNLWLLIDTFHMNIEETNMAESILAAGPFIKHVHAADSNRWVPGNGHLDFKEILSALRKIQYDGFISAECLMKPSKENAYSQNIEFLEDFRGFRVEGLQGVTFWNVLGELEKYYNKPGINL